MKIKLPSSFKKNFLTKRQRFGLGVIVISFGFFLTEQEKCEGEKIKVLVQHFGLSGPTGRMVQLIIGGTLWKGLFLFV